MPTALIAALLATGIAVASLDPVGVVLLVEGVFAGLGAWMLLRRVPRPATTELRYRVPGLDLNVEIAVSTAE